MCDESSSQSVLIHEVNPRSIKIYALNVCGIISKLKFPVLEKTVQILIYCVFLSPSVTTCFAKIPPLNRKDLKHKSGGIVIFVKEFKYFNIEVLECSS